MKPYDAVMLMLSSLLLSSATIETTSTGRIASKKSGCLSGTGICLQGNRSGSKDLQFLFRYDPATASLTCIIDENEIIQKQPEALPFFKAVRQFYVQDEIILTPDIVRSLTLRTAIIPPGSYPLNYLGGKYIITFKR
ncbi:MAG: hypothetical protein IPI46_03710 [Bacteroidetes bacterium]|nr:hypothetical protein [Bacteroidota bacterium]